jgi:hypothetical protein
MSLESGTAHAMRTACGLRLGLALAILTLVLPPSAAGGAAGGASL